MNKLPHFCQKPVYELNLIVYVNLAGHMGRLGRGGGKMLYWAVVFFVIAIIAAIFGFAGIAGAAAWIAKLLFVIFIVLFILTLIFGRKRTVL